MLIFDLSDIQTGLLSTGKQVRSTDLIGTGTTVDEVKEKTKEER